MLRYWTLTSLIFWSWKIIFTFCVLSSRLVPWLEFTLAASAPWNTFALDIHKAHLFTFSKNLLKWNLLSEMLSEHLCLKVQVPSYTIISDSSYHSFLSHRAWVIFKQLPLFIMFYWMSSLCPSSSTLHPKPLCSVPWRSTCMDLSSWQDPIILANCLEPGSLFLYAGPFLVPCFYSGSLP